MLKTDRFMRNLWKQLYADFTRSTGFHGRHPLNEAMLKDGVKGYRLAEPPSLWKDEKLSYTYKWEYQLQTLFKRYRFEDDLYNEQELYELTNKKFLDHQLFLATPRPTLYAKATTRSIVQEARKIMRVLLGDFDPEEVIQNCSFGTKSTVGCPLAKSYYDVKAKTLTGTLQHQAFIDGVTAEDFLLGHAVHGAKRPVVNHLKQVNVAKSFKILRGITPNTTLGAFYTKGLGVVYEDRCRKAGLSIRATQQRHRRYVRRFSKTKTHATVDLSNASNSYFVALLNALLPRKWYRATMFGRIGLLDVPERWDGTEIHIHKLESVMTMGVGFTFPLQTLLFYALLKSIAQHMKVKGLISVYGDDLIFPSEMYPAMQIIFENLGFAINTDKSFCLTSFRESCGSDFFNGVDVRPFQPEGASMNLRGFAACAFLYKVLNGLRRRWSYEETRNATELILRTILQHTPEIHQVPLSFPDTSGVKVSKPIDSPYFKRVKAPYNEGLIFCCVDRKKNARAIESQWIYYWNALRVKSRPRRDSRQITALPPKFHHPLVPQPTRRSCVSKKLKSWLPDLVKASLADYVNLVGEEGMQICWQKRKPVFVKGVKRTRVKPTEPSRKAGSYQQRKSQIPMWA